MHGETEITIVIWSSSLSSHLRSADFLRHILVYIQDSSLDNSLVVIFLLSFVSRGPYFKTGTVLQIVLGYGHGHIPLLKVIENSRFLLIALKYY